MRPATYRYVELPYGEWEKCTVCNGKGVRLESGDLHRSEGWVPCMRCDSGVIKTKLEKLVRVKAGRRVI